MQEPPSWAATPSSARIQQSVPTYFSQKPFHRIRSFTTKKNKFVSCINENTSLQANAMSFRNECAKSYSRFAVRSVRVACLQDSSRASHRDAATIDRPDEHEHD